MPQRTKPPKKPKKKPLQLNHSLAALAQRKQLDKATAAFSKALKRGDPHAVDVHSYTNLINCHVRCGDIDGALAAMKRMATGAGGAHKSLKPNVVTYTAIIKGLCTVGRMGHAWEMLKHMDAAGVKPNIRTANAFLRGCQRNGDVARARAFVEMVRTRWRHAVELDASSYESFVALLAQNLEVDVAAAVAKSLLAAAKGATLATPPSSTSSLTPPASSSTTAATVATTTNTSIVAATGTTKSPKRPRKRRRRAAVGDGGVLLPPLDNGGGRAAGRNPAIFLSVARAALLVGRHSLVHEHLANARTALAHGPAVQQQRNSSSALLSAAAASADGPGAMATTNGGVSPAVLKDRSVRQFAEHRHAEIEREVLTLAAYLASQRVPVDGDNGSCHRNESDQAGHQARAFLVRAYARFFALGTDPWGYRSGLRREGEEQISFLPNPKGENGMMITPITTTTSASSAVSTSTVSPRTAVRSRLNDSFGLSQLRAALVTSDSPELLNELDRSSAISEAVMGAGVEVGSATGDEIAFSFATAFDQTPRRRLSPAEGCGAVQGGDVGHSEREREERQNRERGGGNDGDHDDAGDVDCGLPLRVELCSGSGDWVVDQAERDAAVANWVAVELRHDRAHATFAKMVQARVDNLVVVQADAALLLEHNVAPASVDELFVNHPEPPERTGGGWQGV